MLLTRHTIKRPRPRPTWLSWLLVLFVVQTCTTPSQNHYVEAIELGPFISNLFLRLLNPIIDIFARSTCSYIQSTTFNDDERLLDYLNCDCSGSFNIANGFAVKTFCALTEAICVDPDERIFCGTASVDIDFKSRTSKLRTTACMEIDTGLQIPSLDGEQRTIPELCLSASSIVLAPQTLFRVDACNIQIAARSCRSCTVCPSGTDVQFDCSNIQLLDTLQLGDIMIPGPVVNQCIGIGFLFNFDLFGSMVNRNGTSAAATTKTTTAVTP